MLPARHHPRRLLGKKHEWIFVLNVENAICPCILADTQCSSVYPNLRGLLTTSPTGPRSLPSVTVSLPWMVRWPRASSSYYLSFKFQQVRELPQSPCRIVPTVCLRFNSNQECGYTVPPILLPLSHVPRPRRGGLPRPHGRSTPSKDP